MTLHERNRRPDGVVLEVGGLEWVFPYPWSGQLREHHLGVLGNRTGTGRTLLVTQYVANPARAPAQIGRTLPRCFRELLRPGPAIPSCSSDEPGERSTSLRAERAVETDMAAASFTVLLKPDIAWRIIAAWPSLPGCRSERWPV